MLVSAPERLTLAALPTSPRRLAGRAAAAGWRWTADYARVRTVKGRYVASIVERFATADTWPWIERRACGYWRTNGKGAYEFVAAYRWRRDTDLGVTVSPAEQLDSKGLVAELDRQTEWPPACPAA